MSEKIKPSHAFALLFTLFLGFFTFIKWSNQQFGLISYIVPSSQEAQAIGSGYVVSNSWQIEDLGVLSTSNTQEKQIMFTESDGTKHLVMFYNLFTHLSLPNQLLDINLNQKTYKLTDVVPGRPGPNAFAFLPSNQKLYMASDVPGYLGEYDPKNGTYRQISQLTLRGAQEMDIGDDGNIYVGEYNPVGGAGVDRYNPVSSTFENLGIMDSVQTRPQYAYTVGSDLHYVFVGLGEEPWYLAVYDKETRNKTLYWKSENDTAGAVWHGKDGKWYYYRITASGSELWYQFINGVPVSVPPKIAGVDMYSYNYTSGNTVRTPGMIKIVSNIEINIDNAYPDKLNGGVATVSWRNVGAGSWDSIQAVGFRTEPQTIKRIYFPDSNTILGFVFGYGPIFKYNISNQNTFILGRVPYSLYEAFLDGSSYYFSGYSAANFRYDQNLPWTFNSSIPENERKNTSINPHMYSFSGSGVDGKYDYFLTKGSNGKIYSGIHHERDSTGGALGWYDPSSRQTGGIRDAFLNDDVSDLIAIEGGAKLLYGSTQGKIFLYDTATDRIVTSYTSPTSGETAGKFLEAESGYAVGVSGSKVYKFKTSDGSAVWSKDLGGTAFPGIAPYDRRLVKGPDGYAWLFIGNNLSRINPADGAIQTLATNIPVSSIMFNGLDLYFYGGTNIKVIKNILTCSINCSSPPPIPPPPNPTPPPNPNPTPPPNPALQGITYHLSTVRQGEGKITGNSIDCGQTCNIGILYGTTVTLHATPSNTYTFTKWDSRYCNGTSPDCTFTITEDTTVKAIFTQTKTLPTPTPLTPTTTPILTYTAPLPTVYHPITTHNYTPPHTIVKPKPTISLPTPDTTVQEEQPLPSVHLFSIWDFIKELWYAFLSVLEHIYERVMKGIGRMV